MDRLYTINLTRGAYVVRQDDAERALDAVAASAPHVLVQADLLGDGLYFSQVRVVVAHITSVVENEAEFTSVGSRARLSLVAD